MRLLADQAKIHATFDDPDLVSRAGLVPVMALPCRAGLAVLVEEHVQFSRPCGVNVQVKVPGIVARMTGGADSIDDPDLLRHGANPALFGGIRASQHLPAVPRSQRGAARRLGPMLRAAVVSTVTLRRFRS